MAQEQIVLPTDHFKKRIQHQYADIPLAIAREVIQNSQDAGASQVTFSVKPNSFQATDDGHGMDLDEFRRFYLTLGGTKKQTGSIGGFGAAKELLSFAWGEWFCKGQGFAVNGRGASTPESEIGKGMLRGFRVGARDPDLDGYAVGKALIRLVGLSNLDLDVYRIVDHSKPNEIEQGRTLRSNQVVREFDFGTLYVHKSEPNGFEQTGQLYIRTKGLYTASEYIGGDYVYYLELTAASSKVLTENRDGLRQHVKQTVQKELQALTRNPREVEKRANPTLTIYGDYCPTTSTYNSEVGTFDVADIEEANLWRKPFAVANETGGKIRMTTGTGNPRPKFTRFLEIWGRTLNMVADLAGLERPVPGLYFGDGAVAMHTALGEEYHVVVGDPDLVDTDAFEVLETAIHELAHYKRGSHSQEYESARMEIARAVGSASVAIMDTIRRMQNEPRRLGRYWEE